MESSSEFGIKYSGSGVWRWQGRRTVSMKTASESLMQDNVYQHRNRFDNRRKSNICHLKLVKSFGWSFYTITYYLYYPWGRQYTKNQAKNDWQIDSKQAYNEHRWKLNRLTIPNCILHHRILYLPFLGVQRAFLTDSSHGVPQVPNASKFRVSRKCNCQGPTAGVQ